MIVRSCSPIGNIIPFGLVHSMFLGFSVQLYSMLMIVLLFCLILLKYIMDEEVCWYYFKLVWKRILRRNVSVNGY
ncbi:hypothetical protein VIGAN_05068700 [Vigna angularis var. angularis]|uniref:Uncharacterized protein n=1 Tax=Vigna angularis var. angularis TaxID=157739 RepID=A0A0S3S3C6_PHAAN|nr:hypothetical protein VIGAN_05068700 [Vigna angularis var. angularis]